MTHLYIFNMESVAADYGIGTYLRQLTECFHAEEHLKLTVVTMCAAVKRMKTGWENGIRHISIPPPPISVMELMQTENEKKYCFSVACLLKEYIDETERNVFHFNFFQQESLIGYLKDIVPEAWNVFTIHYINQSFVPMGMEQRKNEKTPAVQTEIGNTQIERIIHAVDKVICLSNYTLRYLSYHHYPMGKVVHIPNGLMDEYKELSVMEKGHIRTRMGFSEDETLFLFVGRLMEAKGIFALMNAFKRIVSQETKVRLLVVGSGDYESCFRERFPCCSQITLMGKMAKEELYQLYQICDVGVHPSLDEQCSYVAIEMMMHRLPMIGTDATGMNEMIEEGHNGYKVFIGEERNPDILEEKFYQGLMRCIQDKASWSILGANARCLYQSTYSLEIMKNRMAQAYFCNVEP